MSDQPRSSIARLLPAATGLAWLWLGASLGVLPMLVTAIPGTLLLATGISSWLYPGDRRIPPLLALGAALSVALSLAMAFPLGFFPGLGLLAASLGSLSCAGRIHLCERPPIGEVPAVALSPALDFECAIDQLLLAPQVLRTSTSTRAQHERIRSELTQARTLFAEHGWLEAPENFHRRPSPPLQIESRRATVGSLSYEHIQFDSEYEPWAEEPGRDRWMAQEANRRCHAWILRHGAPRPWLICIHGYEMGAPHLDLTAFRARRLHDHFGVNLAFPVLPLHGPRRRSKRSGEGYLGADLLDTLHAQAQAVWDLRRMLLWIRSQWAGPVGVYGLSLGGYNAALLSSLEPMDTVVAGIPATDFAALAEHHGSPLEIRTARSHGLDLADARQLFRAISPLTLEPKVAPENRAIFAGVADAIVPPEQPRDLWRHWGRPRIVWYPGGHMTFRRHFSVDRLLEDSLRVGGILPERSQI